MDNLLSSWALAQSLVEAERQRGRHLPPLRSTVMLRDVCRRTRTSRSADRIVCTGTVGAVHQRWLVGPQKWRARSLDDTLTATDTGIVQRTGGLVEPEGLAVSGRTPRGQTSIFSPLTPSASSSWGSSFPQIFHRLGTPYFKNLPAPPGRHLATNVRGTELRNCVSAPQRSIGIYATLSPKPLFLASDASIRPSK